MARKGGWRRAGGRKRFRYLDARGNRIDDPAKLERIESLVIPPAWRDVWISPRGNAKLQATGLDAAGRRQYLYHPDFRARQEQAKFDKLVRFAERLPDLRQAMGEHMLLDPYERERVCAVAVRLINMAWFRVGSDRYAKSSRTYGVTTLYKSHVSVRGQRVSFKFRAKHKLLVRTTLVDSELSTAVRELLDAARRRPALSLRRRRRALQSHRSGLERLHPRVHGRGVHGQGLSNLGRHVDRCDRARRARTCCGREGGEASARGRDAVRG